MTLNYIGNQNSIYYNTVNLKTEYPNVPLQFEVKVGTTADYYIQHSEIIFYDMSNYLEIIIKWYYKGYKGFWHIYILILSHS